MKRFTPFLLVGILFAAGYLRDQLDDWIDATDIPAVISEMSVEVLARDGSLLRAYTVENGRWRLSTSLAAIDPRYIASLIAYEDKRFYSHSGIDALALLRAGYQTAISRKIVSGGSTLTMQVARLLENSGTGRWSGKFRQMRVALALERQLTKDQILALYVDRAPFGGNIEGLRAATRTYFNKDPFRLTPAQIGLLVALPQAPESRRPDRFPERAMQARDRVLDRLGGAGLLDHAEQLAAKSETIPANRNIFPTVAAHLADRAIHQDPTRDQHHLTIDKGLQEKLELLAEQVAGSVGDRISVAIMVADHQNGQILASVGSAHYRNEARRGFVDMTQALRSPGSTLKPLVYALAFDQGLAHPETLIEDSPVAFGTYAPQNFDGAFRGTVRVRSALQQSLNIPVVRLTDAIGPANLVAALRRAGTDPIIPGDRPGLAVALGGVGMTLSDLLTLYAGLANGGNARPLTWRMESGEQPAGDQLISPEAAWQIGNILAGIAPPAGAPRNNLAYKTGTSYGHRDAWALGFDGRHVAGIWIGRADGTPVPGAFGGDIAAPALFTVFERLKPALDPFPPPPPATLIVQTADLPQPLRTFRPRDGVFRQNNSGPEIAFPPNGAIVENAGTLILKVRDGKAPYTWLVNGAPEIFSSYDQQVQLDERSDGFYQISVVDSEGRAAQSDVTLK